MAYLNGKKIIFAPKVVVQEGIKGKTVVKVIEDNGTYFAKDEGDNVIGYSAVEVLVPTGLNTIEKIVTREITSLDLPDITTIGGYAFANCMLDTINAPNVTSVLKGAFAECTALKNINMPKVVQVADGHYPELGVFSYCGASEVYFPLVEYLGEYAFSYSQNLKKVTIGATQIEKEAFSHCTSLDTLIVDTTGDVLPTLKDVNAFLDTPITDGTGYIYTDNPNALKQLENWSEYASQIKSKTEPIIITPLEKSVSTTVNGEPVVLSIFAKSLEGELSYQWYKNGVAIADETNSTLSIGSNKNIEGTYKVIVTNRFNDVVETVTSSECTVTVKDESIIAGEVYTSNVTSSNWYVDKKGRNVFDTYGRYLTNGIINSTYWSPGYLGAKKIAPEITFNFSTTKSIKELQVFAIKDEDANVLLPTNLCVEYKSDVSSEWVTLYNATFFKEEFILVSPKELKVKSLRLSMPIANYTFISEIRAFSETTGKSADGTLMEEETSIIKGLLPSAESTVITSYGAYGTKDIAILTDGFVRTEELSYKKNITFTDSPVSFVYEKENMSFKEVQIASHNPNDLAVKGIGGVKIHAYIDGEWKELVNKTNLDATISTKIYAFTSDETITADKINITLIKNVNSVGWNGMSISEIAVFGEVHTVTPDGKMELK